SANSRSVGEAPADGEAWCQRAVERAAQRQDERGGPEADGSGDGAFGRGTGGAYPGGRHRAVALSTADAGGRGGPRGAGRVHSGQWLLAAHRGTAPARRV